MLSSFSELKTDINGLWGRLSLMQKVIFSGVSISVPIILVIVMLYYRPDYQVLFRNLEPDDVVTIENKLSSASIPSKQGEDGKSILVPAKNVHKSRLLLASQGLPRKKSKGYGLFDEQKLGATEFEQQINYQRALQNELARSIMEIEGIIAARVHLSIPKPTLFTERQKPTKASVLLSLHSPASVKAKQIDGIIHLVAWAVEGLEPENVAVIDSSTGRTLSQKKRYDAMGGLTNEQLEYQWTLEERYEERVVSMLQKAYSDPNTPEQVIAVAKVTVEVDFDTQETTEEKYDPETIISEETMITETADSLPQTGTANSPPQAVGGIPGTPSNVTPSAQTIISNQPAKYTRQDTTRSYKVSKTVSRRITKPKLTRLSAAVMVNDKIQAPLPDLERLVKSAVGYDVSRNDQVEVVRTSFFVPKPITLPKPPIWDKVVEILRYPIVIVLVIIIGLFLLMYTFLRTSRMRELPLEKETPALSAAEAEEEKLLALESEERKQKALAAEEARKQIREDLIEVAEKQPEVIENLIRYWLENET
ncbi:TPA: flagellar M-ring protein FliF [Candidatus Poribacteria bacterium]|nr:flagellar M-ring protein FliF [Candidatus Poribacteria bacterium]